MQRCRLLAVAPGDPLTGRFTPRSLLSSSKRRGVTPRRSHGIFRTHLLSGFSCPSLPYMAFPKSIRTVNPKLQKMSAAERTRARKQKNLAPADHKSAPSRGKDHKSAQQICDPLEARDSMPPVPEHRAMPKDLEAAKLLACDGMRRFGTKVYACRASGIGRSALNDLLKTDEDFRRALWAAKQELYDELETAMTLRGCLPRGDLAGIFVLKHSRKKYREVQRVELTGRDGAPVAYTDAKAELLQRISAHVARSATVVEVAGVGGGRPQLVADVSDRVKRKDGGKGSAGSGGFRKSPK